MAQFPGRNLTVRRLSVYNPDSTDAHDAIMSSPPDWGSYVRAGGENGPFLEETDVELIREYENQPEESVVEIQQTERTGPKYAGVLLKILNNVTDVKVLKYALTLVEDLLTPNLSEHALFFSLKGTMTSPDLLTGTADEVASAESSNSNQDLDAGIFLTLVDHENTYVRQKAIHIVSMLFSIRPSPQESVSNFIGALVDILRRNEDQVMLTVIVRSLTVLLRHARCKALFHQQGGVKLLVGLIQSHMAKMQLLYELSFCIWLLALYEPALGAFDHAILHDLVKLIKSEPRNKVIRMVVSTLRNVLDHHSREKEVSEALIEKGLLKIIANLEMKRIEDPDLLADMSIIKEKLLANYRVLNTFERHEQELLTEQLEPGMVHSEKFWKENVRTFEKDDFGSIKKLVNLVQSEDDTTAALACSDLGFFVQHYPNGKVIVDRMGGKKRIMALLAHKNAEVQKQALLCCSKMMVTNWEFLSISK